MLSQSRNAHSRAPLLDDEDHQLSIDDSASKQENWNDIQGQPNWAALALSPALTQGIEDSAVADNLIGIDGLAGGEGSAGPDGAAAGGKKGGNGGSTVGTSTGGTGTTSGGGTTSGSGSTSGGTTSGGSTSGSTTTSGSFFTSVTSMWQPLKPPVGASSAPTDTYFYKQWGLTSTVAGIDVQKAWTNYTGTGIKVGLIDDGFDYKHSDLSPNYLLGLDYDARTGGTDAFGDPTADNHGTTTMGVIGAAANGTGIVGVAYNAGVTGFRIGFGSNGAVSQIVDAFNHVLSNGMDVVNNSWTYQPAYTDNFLLSAFATSKAAILNDVTSGRGGLGIDIVFSAGNYRNIGDNVNYHNFQNDPFVITVGGTDGTGHFTSYSTPGAALLVSAPDTAYTDDRVGSAGFTTGDYINISGTSYSAPYVSGVVALMLQANPLLGFRDVQDILAYSARNTDPTDANWQTNGAHDWNGGGLHFSPDYGFGLVDATAAVRLAESWQKQSTMADMSYETVVHTDNLAFSYGNVSSTISIGADLFTEKAIVDLNITDSNVSGLTVTLTSPTGTTAVLLSNPTNGSSPNGIVFEATANTFLGENAHGNWTLTINDSLAGNTGTLVGWTLETTGNAPSTPSTYIYTDEFSTATGSGRSVLHDTSGIAGINTAAVTSDSYLDLNPGAVDTIAGRTLQIGTDTVLKSAWTGDGNDTIIANNAGDMIEAGRGNDTIISSGGANKIWGGPGNDMIVYNAPKAAPDTIYDFTRGADVIDLHQLLNAIGYVGTNAVADGWLKLSQDATGTGTNISVDLHNGQGLQVVVDVLGVTNLQKETDYLTMNHTA